MLRLFSDFLIAFFTYASLAKITDISFVAQIFPDSWKNSSPDTAHKITMENNKSRVETDISDACPISAHKVNKNVSRLNALITAIAALIFIFTPFKFIIILLAIDFFIKAYVEPSCSPVSTINRNILNSLKIAPKFINAGPKIFAAKIGFAFCLAITILAFYNFFYAAYALSWMIIVFSGMEFLFGYCIGCHAYSLVQKIYHPVK